MAEQLVVGGIIGPTIACILTNLAHFLQAVWRKSCWWGESFWSHLCLHLNKFGAFFAGGMAEKPVVGGIIGPTFACILGQQFLNLRKGDRQAA